MYDGEDNLETPIEFRKEQGKMNIAASRKLFAISLLVTVAAAIFGFGFPSSLLWMAIYLALVGFLGFAFSYAHRCMGMRQLRDEE